MWPFEAALGRFSTHSVSPPSGLGSRGVLSVGIGVDVPVEVGVPASFESFWRFEECVSGVWLGVLERGEEAAARCMNWIGLGKHSGRRAGPY